jgi:hypothetical protein
MAIGRMATVRMSHSYFTRSAITARRRPPTRVTIGSTTSQSTLLTSTGSTSGLSTQAKLESPTNPSPEESWKDMTIVCTRG